MLTNPQRKALEDVSSGKVRAEKFGCNATTFSGTEARAATMKSLEKRKLIDFIWHKDGYGTWMAEVVLTKEGREELGI